MLSNRGLTVSDSMLFRMYILGLKNDPISFPFKIILKQKVGK